jgi:hypothetical protein
VKLNVFRHWATDYELRNGIPARIAFLRPDGQIGIEAQDTDGRWYPMADRHESGRLNASEECSHDLVLKSERL